MRYLIALVAALGFSSAHAQVVNQATPNQIINGSEHAWTGVTTGTYIPGMEGTGTLYDPATNTIHFFGSINPPAAQIFAINQALANAGDVIRVTGYNYKWEINTLYSSVDTPMVKASVITYHPGGGDVRRVDDFLYSSRFDWNLVQGTIDYTNKSAPSTFGNLEVRFSSNSMGTQVRNVWLSMNYDVDPCASNPLYSTTCTGYQAAYQAQICTANPLYDSSCPGYASALFTQQCSTSPLYSPACPTYSKKVLELVDAVKPKLEDTIIAEVTENIDSSSINPNSVAKKVTPNSAANPAAPVKLDSAKVNLDSDGSGAIKESKDKKAVTAADDSADPKTNREALAKKRREEVKQAAVTKGKELAENSGKAADIASLAAAQNLIIQAMGHSPAFDVYSRTKLPDTQFYAAREVYSGQNNIDAPQGRRLFSGSDLSHQQMIDQQYNIGK